MFIDRAEISVKAGSGGDGCVSFYKDKYTRHPRRDGGDGGDGGDVRLLASRDIETLADFRYRRHFTAGDGRDGSGNKKKGRRGEDCVIKVPIGTLATDSSSGMALRDLTEDGQMLVAAKGGMGAKGNAALHSGAAREKNLGEAGETRRLLLELRLIADAAIVGLPNAGKSSLISRLSRAHPRIASFPFTTKSPVMGTVEFPDFSISVLDIPGLIKGAHQGKGLGDAFLRHIDRCRVLIHLIDMAPCAGRDPYDSYETINKELRAYKRELAERPMVLVANKMDLSGAQDNLVLFRKRLKGSMDILGISCKTGEGIEALLEILCALFDRDGRER